MRSTVKLRTHDSTGYTTGCNGLYRLNTVLTTRGILNSPIPLQSSIRLSDSDRLSKDWCISAFISPKPPIFQQELGTLWEFFLSSPNLSSLFKILFSPLSNTRTWNSLGACPYSSPNLSYLFKFSLSTVGTRGRKFRLERWAVSVYPPFCFQNIFTLEQVTRILKL